VNAPVPDPALSGDDRTAPVDDHATYAPMDPRTDYTEDELAMYSAWTDYRSEYGQHGTVKHMAFCGGWKAARQGIPIAESNSPAYRAGHEAARGLLDIGGVQR
jgi:hypothetical protein